MHSNNKHYTKLIIAKKSLLKNEILQLAFLCQRKNKNVPFQFYFYCNHLQLYQLLSVAIIATLFIKIDANSTKAHILLQNKQLAINPIKENQR